MKTNKKRRVRLTENQLVLLVQLMRESKNIQENKEKISEEEKEKLQFKQNLSNEEKEKLERLERLNSRKNQGERLNSGETQFIKQNESLWKKFINWMKPNPDGFSVKAGLMGMGAAAQQSGEEIRSIQDLYA